MRAMSSGEVAGRTAANCATEKWLVTTVESKSDFDGPLLLSENLWLR